VRALFQDIRYGLRMMAKNPAFTFFVVAVLALGIAANTAIFSIADAVFVRPLPYRQADRLVMVWEDASSSGFPRDTPTPGNFADWKARNQVFEDMAASSYSGSFNLTGDGNPEEIPGDFVTANLFSVLGARPAIGRDFSASDDVPGAPHVVIWSQGLFLRRFGGDSQIIGKQLWLNYEKYDVIGVMPRGFQFSDRDPQLWAPVQFTPAQLANHGNHHLQVVARLKPGVSLKGANANLAAIAKQLEQENPSSNAKVGAFAVPLREELAGKARPALLVLIGAVCFVLLIACANVANLLLARASGRRREIAMRLTLGASRTRIARQLLTESLLLAGLAGVVALVLSTFATQFLASLIPEGIAPMNGSGADSRVLAATLIISVATGILFGILPALGVSRLDLVTSLNQGGRSGIGSGRRLRDALVVSEVALAIILLAGAALMLRGFEKLLHLDPGFRADHVLVVRTPLPRQKYEAFAPRAAFYSDVLTRVARLPGVTAAGYTTWAPLTNSGGATGITVEGRPQPAPGQIPIPNCRIISDDYIRALGMQLIDGRVLDQRDGSAAPPVALINQTMARNLWPGENAIGRRFKRGSYVEASSWITIVGIVGDVHQAGLDSPARPEMYLPYMQQDFGFEPEYLVVRTIGDPLRVADAVRQQVWAVDKEQPVAGAMLLEDLVGDTLAPRKTQAGLLGGFAVLALLLAALGIYAVLLFTVTQRTQEFGVRMDLGAEPADVLRMVFTEGVRLFILGAVIGLAAAFALSRTLEHLLYGVSATDPASLALVTLLLAGVTLLACCFPARRAMRVDPMIALRYE
jgi:putative ABC transport system permease protein